MAQMRKLTIRTPIVQPVAAGVDIVAGQHRVLVLGAGELIRPRNVGGPRAQMYWIQRSQAGIMLSLMKKPGNRIWVVQQRRHQLQGELHLSDGTAQQQANRRQGHSQKMRKLPLGTISQ